jgi:hypothetical protein
VQISCVSILQVREYIFWYYKAAQKINHILVLQAQDSHITSGLIHFITTVKTTFKVPFRAANLNTNLGKISNGSNLTIRLLTWDHLHCILNEGKPQIETH